MELGQPATNWDLKWVLRDYFLNVTMPNNCVAVHRWSAKAVRALYSKI
jgi:hypothetical protein